MRLGIDLSLVGLVTLLDGREIVLSGTSEAGHGNFGVALTADSIIGIGQNYYAYLNPKSQKFRFVHGTTITRSATSAARQKT